MMDLLGKMSFIDLAGSERGADVVDTNKQTRYKIVSPNLRGYRKCLTGWMEQKLINHFWL